MQVRIRQIRNGNHADYRDAGGIKIPYRVTKTWVAGRSVIEFNYIEMNVPSDASKFTKPAAPTETTGAK